VEPFTQLTGNNSAHGRGLMGEVTNVTTDGNREAGFRLAGQRADAVWGALKGLRPMTQHDVVVVDDGDSVGTARRIDQLGRVVLPAELRKMMGIQPGDLLDFRYAGEHIAIYRLEDRCALCGATEALTSLADRHICTSCLVAIRRQPECAICGKFEDLVERNGKHVCSDCVREISLV
jgi:transcriptional pleiotropic regulator of transition state genes